MLVVLLPAVPAQAASQRTWVSGQGSDGNPCTRALPCATLTAAFAATNAGGEIAIIDTGNFTNPTILNITKSISIVSEGATASLGGSSVGLTINAGPSDLIFLRGLTIDGANTASFVGINFNTGGTLHIENCIIKNVALSASSGIHFLPNSASKLTVQDTTVAFIQGGTTGAGILVGPSSGGSAQVVLNRVNVDSGVFGVAVDSSGSTGGINMTVSDSVISGNSQDGIIAVTSGGGAPIGLYVKNTKSVNNNIGIRSIGPNVNVRVDGSSVIGNGTGLSFSGGGALLTFGNNAVRANGSDGAFSGTVGLQ